MYLVYCDTVDHFISVLYIVRSCAIITSVCTPPPCHIGTCSWLGPCATQMVKHWLGTWRSVPATYYPAHKMHE